MTRRLHLLRHAKSSWDDPALADHDRPLSGRGRRAAAAMAAQVPVPDLVLCSTSRRTRETHERLGPALAAAPVRFEPRVYAASADALLDLVRDLPGTVGSVLLIGHNPGLEDLALRLARPSPQRDELEAKFPTGALATLELHDWSADRATLVAFVRPRDLDQG